MKGIFQTRDGQRARERSSWSAWPYNRGWCEIEGKVLNIGVEGGFVWFQNAWSFHFFSPVVGTRKYIFTSSFYFLQLVKHSECGEKKETNRLIWAQNTKDLSRNCAEPKWWLTVREKSSALSALVIRVTAHKWIGSKVCHVSIAFYYRLKASQGLSLRQVTTPSAWRAV